MNGDRRWGRGNAVLALCWISVAGLAWSALIGPILNSAGKLPGGFDPDAGLIMPLVLAVIGGGALRAHEKRQP